MFLDHLLVSLKGLVLQKHFQKSKVKSQKGAHQRFYVTHWLMKKPEGVRFRENLKKRHMDSGMGFPRGSHSEKPTCNAGDMCSTPGLGRSPWRKKWQPTPVFLPGEFHGQSSLEGYSPWGRKELDTTDWLTHPHTRTCTHMLRNAETTLLVDAKWLIYNSKCEGWTIKKAECRRMDAFQLWCWKRLLRVPWTVRRSNQSILKENSPEYSLEGLMLKLKLWPSDAKNWVIGKDPNAGKNWRQEEKGPTEDEIVGWHHGRDGHEFE